MPRRPKRPPDDPEEYARFLEAAKKAEASDDPEALERVVMRVVPKGAPTNRS